MADSSARGVPGGLLRVAVVALLCLSLALAAAPARAGTANGGLAGASRTNPLAGMPWGIYTGSGLGIVPAYQAAQGRNRLLLAKIVRRPLAFWFGVWDSDSGAGQSVSQYIAQTTNGNPNVLVQSVVFRLDPWEGAACSSVPSAAAQRSYRNWIGSFVSGIGSARMAVILQPDLPFSLCSPTRVPLALVAYAARRLTSLRHTTVYIDAGVRYWPAFSQVVGMLEQAGIRYVRGFALNTTEYDGTGPEVEYGARVAQALAAAGIPNKHFVINTAENGAPFLNGQYHGNIENPRVCRNRYDTICATLGIPPTADVASPRWGLSPQDRSLAAHYADAYLWIGRPWLVAGAGGLDLGRTLQLAASTPF